jgi:hypothetical protein
MKSVPIEESLTKLVDPPETVSFFFSGSRSPLVILNAHMLRAEATPDRKVATSDLLREAIPADEFRAWCAEENIEIVWVKEGFSASENHRVTMDERQRFAFKMRWGV